MSTKEAQQRQAVKAANARAEELLAGLHICGEVGRTSEPDQVGVEWRRFLVKFQECVVESTTAVINGALAPDEAPDLFHQIADAIALLGVSPAAIADYNKPYILDAEGRKLRPSLAWVDDFLARLDGEIVQACKLIARFTPKESGGVVSTEAALTLTEAHEALDRHTAKRRELHAYRETIAVPADENVGQDRAPAQPTDQVWVGTITRDWFSPGAMNDTLRAGQLVLFTSNAPDHMYTEDGVKWNAYTTKWDALETKWTDLKWPWLDGLTAADLIAHYPG